MLLISILMGIGNLGMRVIAYVVNSMTAYAPEQNYSGRAKYSQTSTQIALKGGNMTASISSLNLNPLLLCTQISLVSCCSSCARMTREWVWKKFGNSEYRRSMIGVRALSILRYWSTYSHVTKHYCFLTTFL